MKSAQRESNPHFRHGKVDQPASLLVGARYRYIMGASNRWSNCQRTKNGEWLIGER